MSSCSNPTTLHMVAIPYPLRGHINPMLNFCKSVALKRPDFLITFVVTEEWLGLLSSEPDFSRISSNIRFATIPNINPPEKDQARVLKLKAYVEAFRTEMEGPVERLLDRLEAPKPRAILFDTSMKWALGVARRRNIPAASFWIFSATFFALVSDKLGNQLQNGQLLSLLGYPKEIHDVVSDRVIHEMSETLHFARKADHILFNSVYELESETLDRIKGIQSTKIYTTGLAIPFVNENENTSDDHISWLDAQPRASVLYISQGSFLSSSDEQLDEYFAGIHDSAIRFFWVAKDKRDRFQSFHDEIGNKGLVVEWCDQLKVLCHPSIGGFWSHCGWNSVKEAAFSGVPILASPIVFDQITNSKQVVEDWKMGWRLSDDDGRLVKRDEIARVLKKFMDSECEEVKEMRERAVEISNICKNGGSEGGASDLQIEAFINEISN